LIVVARARWAAVATVLVVAATAEAAWAAVATVVAAWVAAAWVAAVRAAAAKAVDHWAAVVWAAAVTALAALAPVVVGAERMACYRGRGRRQRVTRGTGGRTPPRAPTRSDSDARVAHDHGGAMRRCTRRCIATSAAERAAFGGLAHVHSTDHGRLHAARRACLNRPAHLPVWVTSECVVVVGGCGAATRAPAARRALRLRLIQLQLVVEDRPTNSTPPRRVTLCPARGGWSQRATLVRTVGFGRPLTSCRRPLTSCIAMASSATRAMTIFGRDHAELMRSRSFGPKRQHW
jgi:hypothetical protein